MAFKDDYKKYQDLLQQYRPTIRSFIFNILLGKFIQKNRNKKPLNPDNGSFNIKSLIPENLVYLALIQSNEVKQMIRLEAQTAELITSNETQLVVYDEAKQNVSIGMKYDNENFIERIKSEKN